MRDVLSAGKNWEASTGVKSLNKVVNTSLRTEKGCASYTKVIQSRKKYENGVHSGLSDIICWRSQPTS